MPEVREFKSADYEKGDPVPFRLDGEEFLLPGDLPGPFLLDIGEAIARGGDSLNVANAGALDLFRQGMEPAEWERFRAYVAARPHDIHAKVLAGIISWWYQAVSGRPTVPSPSSPSGRQATAAGSTDDSPSPDSTSEA